MTDAIHISQSMSQNDYGPPHRAVEPKYWVRHSEGLNGSPGHALLESLRGTRVLIDFAFCELRQQRICLAFFFETLVQHALIIA